MRWVQVSPVIRHLISWEHRVGAPTTQRNRKRERRGKCQAKKKSNQKGSKETQSVRATAQFYRAWCFPRRLLGLIEIVSSQFRWVSPGFHGPLSHWIEFDCVFTVALLVFFYIWFDFTRFKLFLLGLRSFTVFLRIKRVLSILTGPLSKLFLLSFDGFRQVFMAPYRIGSSSTVFLQLPC